MICWAPRALNPSVISIGAAVFSKITEKMSLYFTMGCPFPFKIAFSHGDLDPSNIWFLGLTRVLNPNDISTGSAVFWRAH